ncbi:hypothetical protein HTV80_00110 [Streptomyces sp. Vc74B-19]|uniref:hypothetical protein n=1 Tax=Streptomyces sp. Vc74B-19 TaxID=2741324 RepID=UPI001BFC4454|nr:hypothetical protein [Streptomyces sp. Vc74B-19]MBT3161517.1 hypothetical protein [Streptomyces sp. Vc74B-19]
MLHTGPCEPWPLDLSCCPDGEDAEAEVLARWQMIATRLLFALSGRRWGPSCPYSVRPCRRACLDSLPLVSSRSYGSPWIPYLGRDGLWRNASVCGCKSDCSCGELCEVRLEGPVHDVLAVDIDGQALPADAYRVDAAGMLVRTDGDCWPDCQELAAPCGEPGTFCVTYRIGLPLDEAAVAAVSELTCHLMKGCGGGGGCGCRANPNITRLSRQGVDVEMADPTLFYSEMRTGLPLVDMWLMVVNPYRQPSPSRVYSPDFKRPRSTTWP